MPDYSLNLGFCRMFLDYMASRDYDTAPVLQAMGLSADELDDFDRRVPRDRFLASLEVAMQVTGDRFLGLHVGEQVRPAHYGVLGLVAMSCETVRQVLEYRERWHQLVAAGEQWEQRTEGKAVRLIKHVPGPEYGDSRPSTECGAASQVTFMRWLTGRQGSPLKIVFEHPRPADMSEYERIFDCPMTFDAPQFELHIPKEVLDLPLLQGNSELRRQMEDRAERLAAELGIARDPLVADIRRLVAQRVAESLPELDEIAALLDMSPRGLQRRLQEAGTSYKQVLDDTRRQIALGYVRDRDMSLTDIAFMLGFSEQSAFSRAFKRWTGQTPAAYRAG